MSFSSICKKRFLISIMITAFVIYGSFETNAAPHKGRLTGVNWFGFETGNFALHGLWARDYKSVLKQVHDLGFNCIRIPWCNEMLTSQPSSIQYNEHNPDPYTGKMGLNIDLEGLSSIEVLDKVIQECERLGLYVILDNHSRQPDGYMSETLWYTEKTPESKWISDWVSMAERYKSYSKVVGFDLNNEPHGNMGTGMKPPATWGYNQDGYSNTDWRAAAEKCGKAILNVHPDALIIVEGTEMYRNTNYWWGGNLQGVRDYPITGIPKQNLIYSPHEYGWGVHPQAWFSAPDFPDNMYQIWDNNFWFIHKENIAPILIGEFGIRNEFADDSTSISYIWLTTLMEYVGNTCSWTFWSLNPNSGDTGGLLLNDWVTVHKGKYNILKPYLAPQGPGSSTLPDDPPAPPDTTVETPPATTDDPPAGCTSIVETENASMLTVSGNFFIIFAPLLYKLVTLCLSQRRKRKKNGLDL